MVGKDNINRASFGAGAIAAASGKATQAGQAAGRLCSNVAVTGGSIAKGKGNVVAIGRAIGSRPGQAQAPTARFDLNRRCVGAIRAG